MDSILISIGIILLIAGIAGCILPILPGPPISYVSLILLQFTKHEPFSTEQLFIYAILVIAVTALDYIVPIWGTKKFGGSKYGIWGSTIGLLVGLFLFPPFGIIIGPFVGAVIGELISGKDFNPALKSGFGSFVGFLAGTVAKLGVSIFIAFKFAQVLL